MASFAFSLSLFLTTILASPTSSAAPFDIGQKVQTTSGTVLGHASTWQPQVSEYLGIPYAIPPLGPLRFAAPKPFKPNSTSAVFTASKHANDCMQYAKAGGSTMGTAELAAYGAGMGGGTKDNPHSFSEDCLGINVWTKPQSGEKGKAVLMWIYGGGFSTGNANAPFYNGARLAEEEDVVVVSFNYRINIFGRT
jgi:cholinesterase